MNSSRINIYSKLSVGRKGFIYTIVAVMFLVIIGSVFFSFSKRDTHESFVSVEHRVQIMNDFIKNLERDSARASYIAGFRSLIAMEQHVTSTGRPLSNSDAVFLQAFVNGSIDGTSYVILQNSTFNDYLLRMQQEVRSQGILCNISIINVSLFQTDPWNLRVNYTLEIFVTDSQSTASFRTNKTFIGMVPIVDIRDPLFAMNTYGRVQRTIKPSNITIFIDDAGNKNDTTEFMHHFNNSYYLATGKGPSILMRFANNTNDSIYGIESLIDTNELVAQGISVNSRASVVDYLYFNATPALAYACNIQNIPSYVQFDYNHLDTYQIQGKLNYTLC